MIIEGVLAGIIGNFLHQKLVDSFRDVYGQSDDVLADRAYIAFLKACEIFFEKYGEKHGPQSDSFLVREKNWELILQSVFYSAPKLDPSNIDERSPSGDFITPLSVIEDFMEILQEEMSKDFLLDKIISEKKFRENVSLTQNEILSRVEILCGVNEAHVVDEEEPIPFYYENEKADYGKIYTVKSLNGNVMRAMVKGRIAFVEYTFNDGAIAYYEVDVVNGSAKNVKLPYPLEEYKIIIPEGLVVREDVANGAGNTKVRTSYLKWGKTLVATYNSMGQLVLFNASGGFSIDHVNRKIEIELPEESN